MKKNFLKKALCIALTAISLTSVATTSQPIQVQAKQTDKVIYDKHGEIDGVAYGVRLCNTKSKEDDFEYKLGTKLTCCETMLRNTNKFPVKVNGKVVYYGKSNKKLKTKSFETYLYANQRKSSGAGTTMLASSGLAKCKITYKVTKVSLKTINEKLKYESDGVYWGGCYSGVKYETSLYNVPLKDGNNDLGKKHYSDRNDKKQAYIKDFDYDKSTGTFTFTVHYTNKITYKAHNLGYGASNGNINIIMDLYDKDGYWIGGEYFSESLVGETFVKGDTATITGTIDVNDLYGVDSLDDVATIDLAFANTFYK
ncbi:MAG: hypothetical protein ACI4EE_04410 [Lachnospiraceae bacterium]